MMHAKLLLVLVLLAAACGSTLQKEIVCDTWTRSDRCYTKLPYCRRYSFEQDSAVPTYTFVCRECEFGFEPIPEGVSKLSLDSSGDLPELESGLKVLELCKRSLELDPQIIQNCNHPQCWHELPDCYRYRVEPLRELDDSFKYARFTCVECSDLFEVVEDGVYGTLKTTDRKLPCRRKSEIRGCGPFCRSEFPGCLKTRIKGVYRLSAGKDYAETELAQYQCLEAEPIHEISMRTFVAETATKVKKYLTIRDYTTPVLKCADRVCLHVFPKCKEYFSVAKDTNTYTYYCKTCNEGYEPVKDGITDKADVDVLWANKTPVELCIIKEVQAAVCGADCQVELPGCVKYSVHDIYFEDNGQQAARFRCDVCKEGLEPLGDVAPALVSAGWGITENQKTRCAPVEMTANELPCDDECKRYMPHCLAYKYDKYEEQIIYKCTKCENEFFPNPDPLSYPWFARQSIQACLKTATNGPLECLGACKKMFPNCKTVTVTTNPTDKTDTYTCDECDDGYFPIQYLPMMSGVLSEKAHFMLRYNQIYLCSDNKDHLYLSKDDCTEANNFYESEHCALAMNCKSLIRFRHRVTGHISYKCEECLAGFVPKHNLPKLYDEDQSLCRPVESAAKPQPARMFAH